MSGVYLMWLEASEIAAAAKPGQFIMVSCNSNLLCRPISIHWVDNNRLAILYAKTGNGTKWLSEQVSNSHIDILGPLGNGYTLLPYAKNILFIAGGMGIAPLLFLAETVIQQGKDVTMLIGAQKASLVLPDKLLPVGIEPVIITDDGSMGKKGRITDFMSEYLDTADQVFACGPAPMYRTMYKNNLLKNKPCQVSLEVRMACGMGVCYGCTIKTRQGLKQVCHDGPVYNFDEVLWDELIDI
ncbi:MAG: dihydroorotate dehydrogenase electron transfer subunit [Dehalococcoidales bacterium]|nr:dihydroorotate dehydrogenase electron transfer subunit [Dehalococcoidales bacterium]